MDKTMLIARIEAHLMRINTADGYEFIDFRRELASIHEIMLDLAKFIIEDVK